MLKKLKAWWNKPHWVDARYRDWEKEKDADRIKQKEICSKLDKFKYRTLSRGFEGIKLWKQDGGNVMRLSTGEANQLLIYLQYSNSEVPRYDIKTPEYSRILGMRALGKKYEYKEIALQLSPPMISFKKDDVRINIYYTTMSVSTSLKHPKKGKTQLFRRKVTMAELEALFKNPRQHTGKGYYTY